MSHKYLFIHFSMCRLVNISLVLSRIFLCKKFYSTRWGNWLWGKKLFWKACAALNRGNYMNVEWLFFFSLPLAKNFFFFLEKLFIFILPCASRLYMSTLWRNNDDKEKKKVHALLKETFCVQEKTSVPSFPFLVFPPTATTALREGKS